MPEAEEGFEEEPGEDPEGSASPGDETPSEEPEDEFKSADAKKLRALLFKELGPLKESRQTVSELRDHIHRLSGMVEQLASRPEPQASREGGDSSRDQSGELDLEKYRPLFQRDFMGGVHTLVQDVLQRERAQNQNQVEDLVRRVREEVRQESSQRDFHQRIYQVYPELNQESPHYNSDFFTRTDQKFRQMVGEQGREVDVKSPLGLTLIRAAAAEVAMEHPELRTSKRTRDDLRDRGDSSYPQGTNRRQPARKENGLPEPSEEDKRVAKAYGIDLSNPEKLKEWQKRHAEKLSRLSPHVLNPRSG